MLLRVHSPDAANDKLAKPLVFERQRLPQARYFALAPPGELAASLAAFAVGDLRMAGAAWTVQSYEASPNAPKSLQSWARRMDGEVREALAAIAPALASHYREDAAALPPARGRVLQLCAVPGGVWASVSAPNELSNPNPGGLHRMTADAQAPSRSFLKVEEALQLLGVEPVPRQRVIDLGAAPGGWSYAFLKRGCAVLAVDNGPMKLKSVENLAGELTHVRANGLTFSPPPGWMPVDWMVSDMLVAPGPCMGLLRRWLQGGWARRYIVNIKLPQREPLAALRPLEQLLAEQPGLNFQVRQLYHDRREVTLMGQVDVRATVRPTTRTTARPGGKPSAAGKFSAAGRPSAGGKFSTAGKPRPGGKPRAARKPGAAGKPSAAGKQRPGRGPRQKRSRP